MEVDGPAVALSVGVRSVPIRDSAPALSDERRGAGLNVVDVDRMGLLFGRAARGL